MHPLPGTQRLRRIWMPHRLGLFLLPKASLKVVSFCYLNFTKLPQARRAGLICVQMYTKFAPSYGGNGRSGESPGNVKLWNNLEGLAHPDLDVDCRDNGVLQSFELQYKTGDAALWRYAFVCCKGAYPAAGIGRYNSRYNFYLGHTFYLPEQLWTLDRSVSRFLCPRASRTKLTRAGCPVQTNSNLPLFRPRRAVLL